MLGYDAISIRMYYYQNTIVGLRRNQINWLVIKSIVRLTQPTTL
jgi:hypothetical protein